MHAVKQALRRTGLRRTYLAAARMRCERTVLAAFGRGKARSGGRILCYHSVGTPQWGVNDVSPARFQCQIALALAAGYRFVPAETIASDGGRPEEIAITFDDGLASVADHAAPILRDYRIPWTLFVVANWADGRHSFGDGTFLGWPAIERLAAQGATIGSHSVTHPNFRYLTPDQAAQELEESRRVIASRLGIDTTSFAIPMGQSRDWPQAAAAAAKAAGYQVVYAQTEQLRPPGTVARTFVTRYDGDRVFHAALEGKFDRWEEWL